MLFYGRSFLALAALSATLVLGQRDFTSPASRMPFWDLFIDRLVEEPYALADAFGPPVTRESVDQTLDLLRNETARPPECVACLVVVGAVNLLIDNGTTDYFEVRDEILDLCRFIFNGTDVDAELLCPGTCDNYAPHVFYIYSTKRGTTDEICKFQEVCKESNFIDRATPVVAVPEARPRLAVDGSAKRPIAAEKAPQMGAMDREAIRKNSLRVFHFTDAHIDEKYMEGTATDCGLVICCREDLPGTGTAGHWGSFSCNVPPRTTELFFEEVAQMNPPIDFILYTGDNPPHATWEESLNGQMAVSAWISSAMKRILPNVDAYACMGNHETFPSNLYWTKRGEIQQLNREFINWWQPMTDWTEEQHRTILDAGYYTMLARQGLRILAFNTNYGYNANWYNWLNVDELEMQKMMTFMEDSMALAASNNEKVILVGHHPSLGAPLRWSNFISQLMVRYHDIVVLYVMGHTHVDEIHLVVDPVDGVPKSMEYVSGSSNSRSNINPSGRIFYLDPITFQVLDYDHYYLDIQENLRNATLKLGYSATTEYGLADLTPPSWHELTVRMETDRELLDKYRANQNGKSGQESDMCLASCQQSIICSMRSATWEERDACLASFP